MNFIFISTARWCFCFDTSIILRLKTVLLFLALARTVLNVHLIVLWGYSRLLSHLADHSFLINLCKGSLFAGHGLTECLSCLPIIVTLVLLAASKTVTFLGINRRVCQLLSRCHMIMPHSIWIVLLTSLQYFQFFLLPSTLGLLI